MQPTEEQVTFRGDGRLVDAYVARPAGDGPFPAVIVAPEIWGLVDHIRDVARRLAGEGLLALVPDLYTGELATAMVPERIAAGMAVLRAAPPEVQRDPAVFARTLADRPPQEQAALATLIRVMGAEQREAFAWDLVGALDYLRSRRDVRRDRVGGLGFCMGGGLTARLATLSPHLRAAVVFYGENPPLDAVDAIRCPVLGLYGGEDRRITDALGDLVRAMAEAGKEFEHHVYPGARHAFFNDTGPNYDAIAARDAWRRVVAFLRRELMA
jgi:carboxymethylenebutenolidase